jgi:hypothetical protein
MSLRASTLTTISTTPKCVLCDTEIKPGAVYHVGFLERPVCACCATLIVQEWTWR